MKRISIAFVLLLVSSLVVMTGCQQMFNSSSGGKTGSVVLKVPGDSGARTILPPAASIAVASYSVSGSGPSGATLAATAESASPFTVSGLSAGSWTLTVNGLDASGAAIASGTASVTVTAGQTASASVTLLPLSGTGTFTLSASWDSTVTVSTVSGTITPVGGTATAFTGTISGSTASYSIATLSAGSYTLVLNATTSGSKSLSWIYALRVYKGLTSTLAPAFTLTDFIGTASSTSTANLTINPATVTGGTVGTSYSFTLTETNVPSGVTQVTFAWNFGDGSSTATGSATATVTNSQASTTISHSFTTQSSFGLSVTASNGTTVLASATAPIVIGTATTRNDQLTALDTWTAADSGGQGLTVDIWDISTLPTGAKFDIEYDMYSIPDKCIIEYPVGTVIWNSGWRGASSYEGDAYYPGGIAGTGAGEQDSLFTKGTTNSFKVTIVGGKPGTAWDYSMRAHN
jgi:hypothetical protein